MSTLSDYLNIRQERLDLQKKVDVMDQKEKQLKADLVDQLRAAASRRSDGRGQDVPD
jgi:hypothetical protein